MKKKINLELIAKFEASAQENYKFICLDRASSTSECTYASMTTEGVFQAFAIGYRCAMDNEEHSSKLKCVRDEYKKTVHRYMELIIDLAPTFSAEQLNVLAGRLGSWFVVIDGSDPQYLIRYDPRDTDESNEAV